MYDTTQQLDNTTTLLTDVTGMVEQDENKLGQLLGAQTIVAKYNAEGLSPDGVELLSHMLKGLGVGSCGLEAFNDNRRTSTQYAHDMLGLAIDSAEEDLTASTENFFDIFKSFSSKALSWVDDSRKQLTTMMSELPRGGKASVVIEADHADLLKSVKDTTTLIEYLLTGYNKQTSRTADEFAEQVRKVFSGRANYGIAIRNMKKLSVAAPEHFKRDGNVYSTDVLFGGTVLSMSINGTDSEAVEKKNKTTHEVDINTEDVLAAAKQLLGSLTAIEKYLKTRTATEENLSKGGDRRNLLLAMPFAMAFVMTTIAGSALPGIYAAMIGSGASLSVPAVKRRWMLLFEDDNQKELFAELKAAVKTMDNTVTVGRRAVSELLSAGKALKA